MNQCISRSPRSSTHTVSPCIRWRSVALSCLLWTALLANLASCAKTFNYTDREAPRYAGDPIRAPLPDPDPELRVVTFNLELAQRIPEAIRLFRTAPELQGADVILLQEMTSEATRRFAEELGFYWVYYPASVSLKHDADFGNALLSRWLIREDRKIILPHLALFGGSQRIAVTGVIEVEGVRVRLYSMHLALPYVGGGAKDQAQRVVADALQGFERVIAGGDCNSGGIGKVFEDAGFSWPTRGMGSTTKFFSVDHIYGYGLPYGADPPAGIAEDPFDSSDHDPVWAVFDLGLELPPGGPAARMFARRDSSLGIKNAAWIDSTLLRGARPNDEALAGLAARGFRTVVNFTRDEDEREVVEGLGMEYVEIPITAHLWSSPPTEEQIDWFLELTNDPARRPLFFHCAAGKDRTGMMAGLYRIEHEGWTNGAAIREMQDFGYHDWFKDLIQVVRAYTAGTYR